MLLCSKPFIVKNENYEEGFKTGCGHCSWCKKQKAAEWATRLQHELPYNDGAAFITLTYTDENLPKAEYYTGIAELGIYGNYFDCAGGTIQKKELQNFIKRLRKNLNKKIKYYAVGEYGTRGTKRAHYHLIVFGIKPSMETFKKVEKSWNKGRISVDQVEDASIRYVANYVHKKLFGEYRQRIYDDTNREAPFQLQSQGIGKRYALDNIANIYNDGVIYSKGHARAVPKYYERKILEHINGEEISDQHYEKVKNRKREKKQIDENERYFDVSNINSELPDSYTDYKQNIHVKLIRDNERLLKQQRDIYRAKEKI